MKKLFTIALSLVVLSVFGQTDPEAYEFLKSVSSPIGEVMEESNDYVRHSVHDDDEAALEQRRKKLVASINAAIQKVESAKPYSRGGSLKREGLDILELMKGIYEVDILETIALAKSKDESYEAMEKYHNARKASREKLKKAQDTFSRLQDGYAQKFGIEITKDEAKALEIQKMSEVSDYTQAISLAVFRATKAADLFIEASKANDATLYEKKRKEAESAAAIAANELKAIGGYKGNTELYKAALDLVETYGEGASGGFKNYETTMKDRVELDQLGKKLNKGKKTQEDVDRYNKLVGEVNDGVNAYNDFINKFNAKSSKSTENYNNALTKFQKTYIPKPEGK